MADVVADPRVYGILQSPESPASFVDRQNELLEVRQKRDEMRQASIDKALIRRAVAESGGDPDLTVQNLMKVSPTAAMTLQKQLDESRKSQADRRKSQFDADNAMWEQITKLSSLATDPTKYQVFRQMVQGADPRLASMMDADYSPEGMQRFGQMMVDAKARFDDQRQRWETTANIEGRAKEGQLDRDARAEEGRLNRESRERVAATRPESAGSDYGRFESDFIAAEAAKRGKTADQLSPSERVSIKTAARKAFGQADDAARRPLAPIVIQTGQGPQLLDRSTGTTRNVRDAQGNIIGQAPTADMRNREAARGLVHKSITAIKEIGDRVIKRVGPAQRLDALRRGAQTVFGNDPDFKVYQDARMALAGNLAVGQQGSRPSDADIRAIWLPMVPDAYSDTADSAKLKWNLIETMSNTAPAQPEAPSSAGPAPTGRYNPATGKVEPVK